MRATLGPRERIRRKSDFAFIYRKGVRFRGTYFSLIYLPSPSGLSRLGVVAGRKVKTDGSTLFKWSDGTALDPSKIVVGDNVMFAYGAYVTDSDWHDIYNRVAVVGKSAPVHIENNAWIGDSVIVCKGVTIGENSVIGAGSVVTSSIPANTIAAGNPARVIRPLDADRKIKTRAEWYADPAALFRQIDRIDACCRHHRMRNAGVDAAHHDGLVP